MAKRTGWTKKQVRAAGELYRHYLFLKRKYGNHYKLPPSEDIDEFWHNHILDTHQYHHDCQRIFGRYLHHYPYFGIDEVSTREDALKAFEVTQQLHYQEFGDYIYRVRLQPLKSIHRVINHRIGHSRQVLRRFFSALMGNKSDAQPCKHSNES